MRTIYLIRHGKPEFPDERKYCIGRTDLPLSEEGRTQIRALGETFAGRRIEKIYTSPLKRCRESAAILQEVIDRSIPIEVVDGLTEIDMGEWDGHSFDEIREQQCKMLRGRECEPCVCRQDEFETTRMVQNRGR